MFRTLLEIYTALIARRSEKQKDSDVGARQDGLPRFPPNLLLTREKN
jgi:hypothetical protein